MSYKNIITRRKRFLLAFIAILTLGLGGLYYPIAFVVPLVMLMGILGIFLCRGRFICGQWCPRGAFFDVFLQKISPQKKIPKLFWHPVFRWSVLILLFSGFAVQLFLVPVSLHRLGHMFWVMCAVTTCLAILLGVLWNHRTWCAFCPIGTLVSTFGKDTQPLNLDLNACVSCGICEKTCPFHLRIFQQNNNKIINPDCLKCEACVNACPKRALFLTA